MNRCPTIGNRLVLVTGLVVLASGLACGEPVKPVASGESVPMFGGTVSRNMANPNAKNVPTDWSVEEGKTKNIKWVAKLGIAAYGGPVIAGGKVFVGTTNSKPRNPKIEGDKGIVMCFEEATGKFLWQAVHDKLGNAEIDFPECGVASTPTVEGHRLWYVSNRCEVICADTEGMTDGNQGVQDEQYKDKADADIIWRLDMIKELDVFPCQLAACSPLVVGDLVYVVTGNGVNEEGKVVNPKAPSFIAVNKTTGKLVWKSNLPGDKIIEGQWSNPAYAEVNGKGQVIFPGGDGWLYSLEPKTGELIWKFDCNPKNVLERPQPGKEAKNSLIATPVVWENKVYVGTGHSPNGNEIGIGHFWCIDITKTGDVSPVNDNFDPKAEVNKKSALVWQYGGPNPDPKARRKMLFCRTLSTCSIHDGLCYITDFDGLLYCFDAKTGEKYWEFDTKSSIWGAPVVMDGKVYFGTENGYLYILKAGKEKPAKELAQIDMTAGVKSAPTFVNGVLFLQVDGVLYAIASK